MIVIKVDNIVTRESDWGQNYANFTLALISQTTYTMRQTPAEIVNLGRVILIIIMPSLAQVVTGGLALLFVDFILMFRCLPDWAWAAARMAE